MIITYQSTVQWGRGKNDISRIKQQSPGPNLQTITEIIAHRPNMKKKGKIDEGTKKSGNKHEN